MLFHLPHAAGGLQKLNRLFDGRTTKAWIGPRELFIPRFVCACPVPDLYPFSIRFRSLAAVLLHRRPLSQLFVLFHQNLVTCDRSRMVAPPTFCDNVTVWQPERLISFLPSSSHQMSSISSFTRPPTPLHPTSLFPPFQRGLVVLGSDLVSGTLFFLCLWHLFKGPAALM